LKTFIRTCLNEIQKANRRGRERGRGENDRGMSILGGVTSGDYAKGADRSVMTGRGGDRGGKGRTGESHKLPREELYKGLKVPIQAKG